MYFVAEGLQEYAWAAKHDEVLIEWRSVCMKRLSRHIEDPRVMISRDVRSGAVSQQGNLDGEPQHRPPRC